MLITHLYQQRHFLLFIMQGQLQLRLPFLEREHQVYLIIKRQSNQDLLTACLESSIQQCLMDKYEEGDANFSIHKSESSLPSHRVKLIVVAQGLWLY